MKDIIDLIEDGKIRRYFATRNKLSFKGAVTHITQHATGKELLFIEESDYLYMIHLMKKIAKKFIFNVLSFVLMSNHMHMLIKLEEENLSTAMKDLFEIYAKFFNKKYGRKGHVFCGPYRYALCLDESYLLSSSIYIHLNPVRAGLVKNPQDYRWSSCNLFLSYVKKDTFIDYKFILSLLNEDIGKAMEQYRQLLERMLLKNKIDILENNKALEFFRDSLVEVLSGIKDIQSGLSGDEDIEQKIRILKETKRLRDPQELRARKFLVEQLMARGYSVADIAKRLNLSRPAVYNILNFTNSAMQNL